MFKQWKAELALYIPLHGISSWKNGESINYLLLDIKGTILGNEYVIKCGAVGNSLRNT
jgi:hypothetical protein